MAQKEPEVAQTAPRLDEEGLSADEIQLRAQGHVGELPRQFSPLSTLALAFSITNSWVGYAATFVTPLYAGAGPAVFWAPIIACIACLFITLGLAEQASAFPSSGGQYHFAFMVSPPKYRAAVAFTAGWLSSFAWLFTTASANLFCASLCVSLATLQNPGFTPTQWQTWLIYTVFIILCTLIVIYLPRSIPKLETFFFWTSLVGFLVNTIVLLAVSPSKQTGSAVFTEWTNLTGWDNGVAMLLAIGQSMYGFLCTDSATHISEELPNPSRHVPRAMWMTIAIGIVTTVPFTLAVLFSTQDFEAVSLSGLPIMEVYLQALRGNTSAALFFTFWILFIYFGATIGLVVTSGRLLWAFSRDNGLPFSAIFAKTHPTRHVPANATILTACFCILYGLIYIGSTTAFNSFVATAILSLNLTYTLPQFIALLRGRDRVLPARQFNLGPYFGTFCNAFACAWVALYAVLFCFPIFLPVTADTMNYVSVVMAGTFLFIVVMWWVAGKRKVFTGPNIGVEGLELLSAINAGDVQRAGVARGSMEAKEAGR
ncbi:uncharacterized protein HMPREF1541_02679 [Cyphellophora europaea CBS 101466]|uniref:Choline transporter n=1 Tax=Cyphellophora europaea (strain CBS 101466) TaxID=1220924 RepID=W2S4J9_CYPE1|nr:uncharacterized protein HMPREF1541_02679 [Cyphellophora europaea CBS 101466]ETN43520.1 hypothetical protein HMPREF1541_02679 [Cyphellophora europaea CBS 101466]